MHPRIGLLNHPRISHKSPFLLLDIDVLLDHCSNEPHKGFQTQSAWIPPTAGLLLTFGAAPHDIVAESTLVKRNLPQHERPTPAHRHVQPSRVGRAVTAMNRRAHLHEVRPHLLDVHHQLT